MDYSSVSAKNFELVKEGFPSKDISDVDDIIKKLFRHKDDAALRVIKASCDIAATMIKASFDKIAPGVHEW